MDELLKKISELNDMTNDQMEKEANRNFDGMSDSQKVGSTTAAVIGSVGHIRELINGKDTLSSKDIKRLETITNDIQEAMLQCATVFNVDMEHVMTTIILADLTMQLLQGDED